MNKLVFVWLQMFLIMWLWKTYFLWHWENNKRCCMSFVLGEQSKAWAQHLLLHALLQGCSSGNRSDRCEMVCVFESCLVLCWWFTQASEPLSGMLCIFGACGGRPTLIGTWSRTWQCLQAFSVILYFWYPSSCLSFVYVWGCSLCFWTHWRGFTGLQSDTKTRIPAFKYFTTGSLVSQTLGEHFIVKNVLFQCSIELLFLMFI